MFFISNFVKYLNETTMKTIILTTFIFGCAYGLTAQTQKEFTPKKQVNAVHREKGVTEDFRKTEMSNNEDRIAKSKVEEKEIAKKTIITKEQFEMQSDRGREYIQAHPELFTIEQK
jgi:hypothetical protein